MNIGPMLNLYPDSLGGTLDDVVDFLKTEEAEGAFSSCYILPSLYHTDLDRGFSVIDYSLNKMYASGETLEAINIGLKDARDGSINLTLIGCKKIPSRGFLHFDMLKSIVLPDVTEIGENAFSDCPGLQKVVLGNLTKVYGNVRNNGIFDYCETRFIDLVLSKDQKVMNDGEAEGRYCWTADIITDYDLSDEHVSKKFLGYEFKSITCRYKFE